MSMDLEKTESAEKLKIDLIERLDKNASVFMTAEGIADAMSYIRRIYPCNDPDIDLLNIARNVSNRISARLYMLSDYAKTLEPKDMGKLVELADGSGDGCPLFDQHLVKVIDEKKVSNLLTRIHVIASDLAGIDLYKDIKYRVDKIVKAAEKGN